MGKYVVHQVETPYLVRLKLLLGGRLVSQGLSFETDSPTAIHPIGTVLNRRIGDFFSRFTPLDPLCSAQQGHLS